MVIGSLVEEKDALEAIEEKDEKKRKKIRPKKLDSDTMLK